MGWVCTEKAIDGLVFHGEGDWWGSFSRRRRLGGQLSTEKAIGGAVFHGEGD